MERQGIAEETSQVNQVGIFPEGSISNGAYILPFKKGAF
jgi:1-acyl-sn-glycerol-3-phosphate acyltransferase